MTTAGVKYVSMNDSCRSHIVNLYESWRSEQSPCMFKYVNMFDSCKSQLYICMTPAGDKYVSLYDCCRRQMCYNE